MMKLKFLAALATAILLSACATTAKQPAEENRLPLIESKLNLPEQINFDGKVYTRQYVTDYAAEYYLENEQDFTWTNLITINYIPSQDLNAYLTSLHNTHKQGNAQNKREYKINKINSNKATAQELYYPNPKDENYNKYEADLKVYDVKECGIVAAQYGTNFKKTAKPKQIKKTVWQGKSKLFNQKYPKIECR